MIIEKVYKINENSFVKKFQLPKPIELLFLGSKNNYVKI